MFSCASLKREETSFLALSCHQHSDQRNKLYGNAPFLGIEVHTLSTLCSHKRRIPPIDHIDHNGNRCIRYIAESLGNKHFVCMWHICTQPNTLNKRLVHNTHILCLQDIWHKIGLCNPSTCSQQTVSCIFCSH